MIGPSHRVYLALLLTGFFLAGCTSSPMSRIDANRAVYESWPFEMQEAVLAGKIVPGMAPEMVKMTLGEPSEVTGRNGRKGVEEVWIYKKSSGGGLAKVLRNTDLSIGGGMGPVMLGGGTNLASLGSGPSSEPVVDEQEVVFQNGVVVRSDAGK
jgi:hypothetical protein